MVHRDGAISMPALDLLLRTKIMVVYNLFAGLPSFLCKQDVPKVRLIYSAVGPGPR